MRTLAIDPGATRIGVAVSDAAGRLALPVAILSRDAAGEWLRRLADLVAERGVERVVVGLPLTLRGETGPAAQQALALAAGLRDRLPVEVVTWDERLSSAQVEKELQQAGLSSRERRGRMDAAAACLILQSYLEAHAQPEDPAT